MAAFKISACGAGLAPTTIFCKSPEAAVVSSAVVSAAVVSSALLSAAVVSAALFPEHPAMLAAAKTAAVTTPNVFFIMFSPLILKKY